MNAVTQPVELALPKAPSFDDWLQAGRNLAAMHKRLGFMVGDWINHGREHFSEQMNLALESAGIDAKFAMKAANVAKLFPEHCRAKGLSYEHHRALVKLPPPQRVELLKKADEKHWRVPELREAVVQWRYENGELFDEDDRDSDLCTLIVRSWNRATVKARRDFMARAELVNFGVIDEDEVQDEPQG